MLPDLENLIRLQQLEDATADARAKIDALPARLEAMEARIAERERAVTAASESLNSQKTARATVEKDVAEIQSRLNRFKDQLMAVKTNKEYHAIQTEIAGAEQELHRLEDGLLERMLEADELSGNVRQAEQQLAEERAAADQERRDLDAERDALKELLAKLDGERSPLFGHLAPPSKDLFGDIGTWPKGCRRCRGSRRSLHLVPRSPSPPTVQRRALEQRAGSV